MTRASVVIGGWVLLLGSVSLFGCRAEAVDAIKPAPEHLRATPQAIAENAPSPASPLARTVRGTVTDVSGDTMTIATTNGTRTARLGRTSRLTHRGRGLSRMPLAAEVRARVSLSDEWESVDWLK